VKGQQQQSCGEEGDLHDSLLRRHLGEHLGGDLLELSGPRFEPVDYHGAGDSMVAALAVGVARGPSLARRVKLAVVAGGLNVTRRGLGSGQPGDIERVVEAV
jgi:sugar/nucleoside kinase (ribokinase family)